MGRQSTAVSTASVLSERDARKYIAQGKARIEDLASILIALHHGKAWLALKYDTWADMIRLEFGHTASWASRILKAAEVKAALPRGNNGEPPDLPEKAIRELRKLPEEERGPALAAIQAEHGPKPTVRQVAEYVEEFQDGPPEEAPEDAPTIRVCARCGGKEFDNDGDCTTCWEPSGGEPTEAPESPVEGTEQEEGTDDAPPPACPLAALLDDVVGCVQEWYFQQNKHDWAETWLAVEGRAASMRLRKLDSVSD